ncbi:MAG: hypothetical protein AMXMBFR57_12930 [Acidimicrobiia bacterium]
MVIVETPIFTKRVLQALTDDEYRALQAALVASPGAGPVIPGGAGFGSCAGLAVVVENAAARG